MITEKILQTGVDQIIDVATYPLDMLIDINNTSFRDILKAISNNDAVSTIKNIFHILVFANHDATIIHERIDLKPEFIYTDRHPFRHTSFSSAQYLIESDYACEKRENEHIAELINKIEQYGIYYGFWKNSANLTDYTRKVIWYDAAPGVRLVVFLYALLRMSGMDAYSDSQLEYFFRLILDQALWLAADEHYVHRHNHGLIQMYGLATFCRICEFVKLAPCLRRIVERRVLNMIASNCSSEGTVLEHSTGYQDYFIRLLQNFVDFALLGNENLQKLDEFLGKMLESFRHFITPDGKALRYGDTRYSEPSRRISELLATVPPVKDESSVKLFREAGYGFLLTGKTQCFLAASFHSRTHKHCDDLSVLWQEGDLPVLTEAGCYGLFGRTPPGSALSKKGFWYSDPKRIYAESAHAHNCVEINGESWSRMVTPYGACPLDGGEAGNGLWYLQAVWKRPERYTQRRILVLKPECWLLVYDRLTPLPEQKKDARFSQWLHFHPEAEVQEKTAKGAILSLRGTAIHCRRLLPDGRFSLHRGEDTPRLQGWYAEDATTLIPSPALAFHYEGREAMFAALCSLNEACAQADIVLSPARPGKKMKLLGTLRFAGGAEATFAVPYL
jgi:hypothetical protein